MLSGVTECIIELHQIKEDLKKTVIEKFLVHTGVEARPDVVGTSGKDKEQPNGTEKVARPFFAINIDMKCVVDILCQSLKFRLSRSHQQDMQNPII